MKIAYLITAYNNFLHLERLINALNDRTNPVFYVHIDKKSKMPDIFNNLKNVIFIKRRRIWWGGWSHLASIIDLIREASRNNYEYYILLRNCYEITCLF
jgi:hypothetical protein